MKIKQLPEDFIVEEHIDLNLQKEGPQSYFWLIKRNWTTQGAIAELAKRAGLSYRRFKFAGSKDKSALTKQAISVFKVNPEKLLSLKIKDIKLEFIGFGEKPISIGSAKGNRFKITIRDLGSEDCKKIKKNLLKIKTKGFRNYFGPQRFGRGNTAEIGKEILKGNLEGAAKEFICFESEKEGEEKRKFRELASQKWGSWQVLYSSCPRVLKLESALLSWLIRNERDFAGALRVLPKHIRKLFVHAYQAKIWNSALSSLKKISKKSYPLPGYETKLGNDSFSRKVKELLAKDGLTLDSFKVRRMPELGVKGELRAAIVKPKNLKLGKFEEDELNKSKAKVLISFDLPSGSYATVLLDALVC